MKAEEFLNQKKDVARNFHEKRVVVDMKTVYRALQIHEQEIRQQIIPQNKTVL